MSPGTHAIVGAVGSALPLDTGAAAMLWNAHGSVLEDMAIELSVSLATVFDKTPSLSPAAVSVLLPHAVDPSRGLMKTLLDACEASLVDYGSFVY